MPVCHWNSTELQCLHFSGLFSKLRLATQCNSLFYLMLSTAGKVMLPHVQQTSEVHH